MSALAADLAPLLLTLIRCKPIVLADCSGLHNAFVCTGALCVLLAYNTSIISTRGWRSLFVSCKYDLLPTNIRGNAQRNELFLIFNQQ